MAYYTGQCSNYQHLADILVEKCQAHGWTWQNNSLHKKKMQVKVWVCNTPRHYNTGEGIVLTGITNDSESAIQPRLGGLGIVNENIFPAIYHLFIFEHEVYLIMKFDVDKFYHLTFGQSLFSNAVWLSANTSQYCHSTDKFIYITPTTGGVASYSVTSSAPFWGGAYQTAQWCNCTIQHNIDGHVWSGYSSQAYSSFQPLVERLPNQVFSDSPLLPYQIFLERAESKLSLIAQFEHARFVRVDNYEPEQIITLGHEKWMIFPFFRKNVTARNGGVNLEHSGTFGWAIRYEG